MNYSGIAYKTYSGFWNSLNWIFPASCVGCGKLGEVFCSNCLLDVHWVGESICKICGTKLINKSICARCMRKKPNFDEMRAVAWYEGKLRNAIHQLKYQGDVGLAYELSKILIKYKQIQTWSVDLVTPVPLNELRQKERGYNQSALLALPVALYTGAKYQPQIIVRIKDTISQVGLSIEERRLNVHEAFKADPRLVLGKRILLIDDVVTTGATMESAALALKKAGAEKVYCLALAHAVYTKEHVIS